MRRMLSLPRLSLLPIAISLAGCNAAPISSGELSAHVDSAKADRAEGLDGRQIEVVGVGTTACGGYVSSVELAATLPDIELRLAEHRAQPDPEGLPYDQFQRLKLRAIIEQGILRERNDATNAQAVQFAVESYLQGWVTGLNEGDTNGNVLPSQSEGTRWLELRDEVRSRCAQTPDDSIYSVANAAMRALRGQ